ncbi:hypothetical protein GE09DRAFT_1074247 [Coniochaeta sp. 2T2.1]|nr:hypothetical protein GE09DRAFT_1074247 [Coniochaeta sp. 2T2.1]
MPVVPPPSTDAADDPSHHPSGRIPLSIERNMNARALLPTHKPLLDFFRTSLSSFQSSSSSTPFSVICTLAPRPPRDSPAQLLNHRILANPLPSPFPPVVAPPEKLVVLDSSFNPPSAAHLRMASDAVLFELKNAGTDDKEREKVRLLLLLAVKNADKAAKPAPFEQRLAMMWAFARDVRTSLEETEQGGVNIDVALSTQPFFHEKSAAIAASGFYRPGEDRGGKEGDGKEAETEQVVLVGYDTLIRILDPKYYGPSGNETEAGSAGEAPIRKALDPFFKRARLRVTMRTNDEWGGKDEQTAYVERLLKGEELEKIGGDKAWAKRIELVHGRKEGEVVVSSTLAREAAKKKDWNRLEELVPGEVKKWIEREGLYGDA